MKRGKKMMLLLVLLCVLLGGYAMLGQMNPTETVEQTEGSYPLWPQDKAVAGMAWQREGEAFSFTRGENVWMKDDDAAFPVNQTVADQMAGTIENLTGMSKLTDVTKPEDYGLDQPAFSVTVRDEAGSETVYAMGDRTPFEDGYYLSVSGSEDVYVISTSLASAFDKTTTQLAQMEALPEVTQVTRLTVGDTLDVSFSEESGAWSDTATGELLDHSAVEDLVNIAKNLGWNELKTAKATQAQLEEWTLDDPQAMKLTLYNGENAERTLLLGAALEDENRYARLEDSSMVYSVYGTDADKLLCAGVDTLYMKKVSGMGFDLMSEFTFAWNGGERTLSDSDSESVTMQSIIDQLESLEGTQRVELGELSDPILTLNARDAEGTTKTLSIHAYNVDSYLLPITNTHGMLVPAESVDKLIRMLKQQG